jgi:hypothetical protein
MFSDDLAFRHDPEMLRIGPQGDGFPRILRRYAIAIAIISHQAGGRDPQGLFEIAVEGDRDGPQA